MSYSTNSKVKKIMEEKGINRKVLASKLGIHVSSLPYLLNNDIFERPKKIAQALGVNLKDIIE